MQKFSSHLMYANYLITIVCLFCVYIPNNCIASGNDTTEPKLESISISPVEIDVSTSDKSVCVTAQMTDDISGIASANILIYNPSGDYFDSIGISSGHLISGSLTNGTFKNCATVPIYSPEGQYTFDVQRINDAVGNENFFPLKDQEAFEVTKKDKTTMPWIMLLLNE